MLKILFYAFCGSQGQLIVEFVYGNANIGQMFLYHMISAGFLFAKHKTEFLNVLAGNGFRNGISCSTYQYNLIP